MSRLSIVVFALALACAIPAHAARDVDILVARLVEKGILTQEEGTALIVEMRAARAIVPEQDLAAVPPRAAPAAQWAERIDIDGDLRVRYDSTRVDDAPPAIADAEQDRMRLRWRLGADAQVADAWQVGFGLASGGADPRSTNQTLAGAFSRGDARLDYAYARYQAGERTELVAGKFRNLLWEPKDLLWDTDIRTDGVAARHRFAIGDRVDGFVTPAYLVLTEDFADGRSDAAIWALQVGATFALGERTALTLAPTYYAFDDTQGTPGPVSLTLETNSRDADGNLLYDYDAVTFAAELTVNDVGPFARWQVFGEGVRALDPGDADTGWVLGTRVGTARVAERGDWQIGYSRRRLERDAWPEFLGDSESFFGATNFEGDEIELAWGLAPNVWLAVDYYAGFEFIGTDVEEDVVTLDLNLRW